MMFVKNKTLKDYVLGHANALQLDELAAWVSGSDARAHWLFGLCDAFLSHKRLHHFEDKAAIDAAEQRLFDAIGNEVRRK